MRFRSVFVLLFVVLAIFGLTATAMAATLPAAGATLSDQLVTFSADPTGPGSVSTYVDNRLVARSTAKVVWAPDDGVAGYRVPSFKLMVADGAHTLKVVGPGCNRTIAFTVDAAPKAVSASDDGANLTVAFTDDVACTVWNPNAPLDTPTSVSSVKLANGLWKTTFVCPAAVGARDLGASTVDWDGRPYEFKTWQNKVVAAGGSQSTIYVYESSTPSCGHYGDYDPESIWEHETKCLGW